MRHTLSLVILGLGLTAGCSLLSDHSHRSGDEHYSSSRSSNLEPVPNSLLAYLPDGKRSEIEEARAAEAKARDESAAAERRVHVREDQLKIAMQDVEIARAEMKKAELILRLAQGGTQEDLDRAHQNVRDTQALVDTTRARITWRERNIDSAQADEELTRAKLALTSARVELAKARAVHELDRPETRRIDVGSYEREVRLREEAVAVAEARSEAKQKEVKIARDSFDDRAKSVPATYKHNWDDNEVETHARN